MNTPSLLLEQYDMSSFKINGPVFPCDKKPEIDYPCLWVYKVIGNDPESVREAITAACTSNPVKISPSHSSSGGKYWSLKAELEVKDENMRLAIYQSLTRHPAVKLVL
jgi:uncharacterized protein